MMKQVDAQKSGPVAFRFRDIGPVKDARLELGDLTIVAGRNNTGKTYIVYTLYGFLKMWMDLYETGFYRFGGKMSRVGFPDIQKIIGEVIREGHVSFPLSRVILNRQRKVAIRRLSRSFSQHALSNIFKSQKSDFEDSSIEVILNGDIPNDSAKVEIAEGVFLSIKYDGSNLVVSTNAIEKRHVRRIHSVISSFYLQLLVREDQLPIPFILSAERFGISLFYRDLDFRKNQLVDLLQKMGDEKERHKVSPYLIIERATSRYALPIKDNIDFTRSIPDLRARKSEFYDHKLFDEIKEMMDGYYSAAGDDIRFISKARGKGRSFNIPLHLASSSARGMSDCYFFLRHVAKSNHLLIIDEPESHLDTANQIQLARLLARFVRAGLKVLVTTHSDYLIKEINNLVMLSRPFADKDGVVKKFKYGSADALEPTAIHAYVAENNSLTRCAVDSFGIDMPVFDTTIDQINRVSNELASRLAEETEA